MENENQNNKLSKRSKTGLIFMAALICAIFAFFLGFIVVSIVMDIFKGKKKVYPTKT